jgi:hypothetical protein
MFTQSERHIHIGGRNLAISGDLNQDWFIGFSPEYDSLAAEGPWEEWVRLARAILTENEKRALHSKSHQQPQR